MPQSNASRRLLIKMQSRVSSKGHCKEQRKALFAVGLPVLRLFLRSGPSIAREAVLLGAKTPASLYLDSYHFGSDRVPP
jgi:hypothetical protein